MIILSVINRALETFFLWFDHSDCIDQSFLVYIYIINDCLHKYKCKDVILMATHTNRNVKMWYKWLLRNINVKTWYKLLLTQQQAVTVICMVLRPAWQMSLRYNGLWVDLLSPLSIFRGVALTLTVTDAGQLVLICRSSWWKHFSCSSRSDLRIIQIWR